MRSRRLWMLYLVEAVTALATPMLIVSIYFYTEKKFGWSMRRNLLLAAAEGAVYVAGSLLANPISQKFGRRRSVLALFILVGTIASVGAFWPTPAVVTSLLIIYTMLTALIWPMVESLVSAGIPAQQLSKVLGVYNLVWAGVGAIAVAGNGFIIEHWPRGVFVIPALAHGLGFILLLLTAPTPANHQPEKIDHRPQNFLEQQRRLALWLSRIALPATYIVIFSLSAMLPSLPAIKRLPTSYATLIGSAWLAARWITFLFLGATHWWHTRPGLLFWAALAMLIGFIGTVLPATHPGSLTPILAIMISSQIILGLSIGLIYSASLYFGMVLSEGSTEHGGYHEALIGLGQTIGPLSAAAAQSLYPTTPLPGIVAVSSLITLAILTAAFAALRARK